MTGVGSTGLHISVDKGSSDIIELLVGHGIDLSIICSNGLTALHIALGKEIVVGITDNCPELSKVKQDLY